MAGEALHERARGTDNHPDTGGASTAANHDDSTRAATRRPGRSRAFAGLLAEASVRGVDALSGDVDATGVLTQIMP